MGKRKAGDMDGDDDRPPPPPGGPSIGQLTAGIANKQVRSQRYHKLKQEKDKKKKVDRKKKEREAAKAEELGLPPPVKQIPKVRFEN